MMERASGGEHASSPGILASLRGLTATALAIAQTRLQLLANEMQEQGAHGLQMLALAAIALFCGAIGILLLTAWLVIALWDQYRLLTVGVLALVYLAGCVAALRVLKLKAAERPQLFAASLAELQRDRDLLQP
jgi:uncharacterized membrane protein YqjE